jgi:hypothetical protein
VFLIAAIVYILTMEPHGSLWDCGEFAGTAARLGVPHPPGAPLFILIGRIFAIFGKMIGLGEGGGLALMSALCSAFTILFLFWTVTHFAKKIKLKSLRATPANTENQSITGVNNLSHREIFDIMAAGVIGALAYTFSDSFWYSAVESEVYAMSSLCTAVVFWAALKWEDHPENNMAGSVNGRNNADKWMILIFFIIGMSIGVHLLNILTIPAIILIYYFKRYKKSNKGILAALFMSVLILGFVQKVVGQWSISMAFPFERLFVNDFGLPVLSGFVFFFVLLGVGFFFLLRWANKTNRGTLRLSIWCLSFTLIGMSTYMTTMIRSKANPGIDMYNVDNPYALNGYLSREQYGDFPLLYGQHYEASQTGSNEKEDKYILGKDENGKLKYIKTGVNREITYDSKDEMLFPRIWYSQEENRKQFYKQWLTPKSEVLEIVYEPGQKSYQRVSQSVTDVYDSEQEAEAAAENANKMAKPANDNAQKNGGQVLQYIVRDHLTYGKNLNWLFSYQINWMYLRYFMWNFAGKQNDIQGFSSKRDGNWISGISFLDNARLGNQAYMPDALKNNKANNKLYFLPLILGLIGLVFQLKKHPEDWMVNLLLFLMTGLAIVFYLNQYGLQPRERDYAFVGSFYAFAIWIGLGVLQVRDWFAKLMKGMVPGVLAAGICFIAVPMLMLSQEWDDHDRSHKLLARDLAKDYLMSCPKNAILFTIGDNDTYPLWYAQEVEGIRTDIRVVNTSLLGIDWYLDQLRYKVNESDAFNMVWNEKDYAGPKMEYARELQSPLYQNSNLSLDSFLRVATTLTDGDEYTGDYYFPGRNYYLKVNPEKASKIMNLTAGDTLLSIVPGQISRSKQYLSKGDFGIYNILAANINDRPICFTDDNGADLGPLGIQPYLRRQGMVFQYIPSLKFKKVETAITKGIMMSEFGFGNASHKGVYYDEENRRHLSSIRDSYIVTADDMVNDGDLEGARKMLRKVHEGMPSYSLPYGMPSRGEMNNTSSLNMARTAFMAKDEALGKEIYNEVEKDVMQQMKYDYMLSNPNGNPTKENVDLFIKDFSELYALYNKRQVTRDENTRIGVLQEKLIKNKLSGFTVQDVYGNMRNYNTLNQIKDIFIAPKTPEIPVSETPVKPIVNPPPVQNKKPDSPKIK